MSQAAAGCFCCMCFKGNRGTHHEHVADATLFDHGKQKRKQWTDVDLFFLLGIHMNHQDRSEEG